MSTIKVDAIQTVNGTGDVNFTGAGGISLSSVKLSTIKSSNGTTAMNVDSSGRVTEPTKPCFFAYMGTGAPVSAFDATNTTKTPINQTLVNIGNCWSTTNYEFTAPVAGTYSINWGATFQDPDEARYVASRVFKNGSQIGSYHRVYHPVEETEQAGNDYGGVDHNIILTFTAGEKFHVIFQPSDTLTLAAEEGTYVSGFLIG